MNPRLCDAMEPGKRYIARTATKCGTIRAGDRLVRSESGTLSCLNAGGWLERGAWERFRPLVEIDRAHYAAVIERARKEIEEARKAIA